MSATFTAVVTAHAESPHRILGNILYQTRKPDEILCYVSDLPLETYEQLVEDFPTVTFSRQPNKMDWGHDKRAKGLERASMDYVGFFNHDDAYDIEYLEEMLGHADGGADVVFCQWLGTESPDDCEFASCSSTVGNWIGRTSLVQQAGYTGRDYTADATLIEAVKEIASSIVKVDETLYVHNVTESGENLV